ncbi:hypothetical protein, partial [Staphylococcus saprophyticus]|uniref:hypothetical protein n=1 Tax=Staphylococcus saprophyticus TaxID=29385 RepID=UPI0028CB7BDE
TNTKLLQNQLLQNHIPPIKKPLHFKINPTLIKTKPHYIPLPLITQILQQQSTNYQLSIFNIQLLISITQTHTP